MALADVTIYLPNRRAARELAGIFTKRSPGGASILPQIRTLGDIGEEAFGLELTGAEVLASTGRVIRPVERTLELARFVQAWTDQLTQNMRELLDDETIRIPAAPADAIRMAEDLSRLLHQIMLEEVSWKAIREIVPDAFANEWWRFTAIFMRIVLEHWPEHLAEKGLVDPSARQGELLNRQSRLYREAGSRGPVIAAGSTGSAAPVQRLLQAIAGLEQGAVVLPGVDLSMEPDAWNRLSDPRSAGDPTLESHPQYGLARLLRQCGVDRPQVIDLSASSEALETRGRLVNLALLPASDTQTWVEALGEEEPLSVEEAYSRVAIVDAPNERAEALAIAIALRETLEQDDKTAALVTPDRGLARRVAAELARFGISIDDTAGEPLQSTPACSYLRNLIQIAFLPDSPATITALLKNPLTRVGTAAGETDRLAALFELAVLRDIFSMPKPGAFQAAVKARRAVLEGNFRAPRAIKPLDAAGWDALEHYGEKLDEAFQPILPFMEQAGDTQREKYSLPDLLVAVAETADRLSRDESGQSVFLSARGGPELETLFGDVLEAGDTGFGIEPRQLLPVFDALIAPIIVRPSRPAFDRIRIYGPLETRLLNHDRVILGGLNEGTWPQLTKNDPFLHRSMRAALGMATPERRIGLAAHDFQQLMGKAEVILTRSQRQDKAPAVMSRWLQRLITLLGENHAKAMMANGQKYLDLAYRLDQPSKVEEPAGRPCPTPPVSSRPTELWVSDIETWVRDPYALYAKRILKLPPLPPLNRLPDPALKGSIYHDVLREFVEKGGVTGHYEQDFERITEIAFLRIGAENLPVEISSIWLLRFREVASAYLEWEKQRLVAISKSHCEVSGELPVLDGEFTLKARADRIDRLTDGSLEVIDYKTGSTPSPNQARSHQPPLAPQLGLEGAIARNGGFSGLDAAELSNLAFYRLRRGQEGREEPIASKDIDANTLSQLILGDLETLVRAYQNENTGYLSRAHLFEEGRITGDYDHLARTREWSIQEPGGGNE